jgi:protein MAK11
MGLSLLCVIIMKRKRNADGPVENTVSKQVRLKDNSTSVHELTPSTTATDSTSAQFTHIQVIVGSYERALYGFTASVLSTSSGDLSSSSTHITFTSNFLFNAHASSIRCLALSPPSPETDTRKVFLATGGADERINLYHLSTNLADVQGSEINLPSIKDTPITENPQNREVGSLLHHSSAITRLYFPSRSKLISASEDNTVAISRTRDWTVLSSIKVPIPKPVGRPSGDTVAPGEVPAGVNDFAVHPSMKLMITVGKGESCMRLWNLVTGRKAGVLNFDKEVLRRLGEGKWSTGEARKVNFDSLGEDFIVAFDRGAVIYGLVSLL